MRTVTHRNGTVGEVFYEYTWSFAVRANGREVVWLKKKVLAPDGWAEPIGAAPGKQAKAVANSADDAADPETVDTSGADGMIPADVLDLVDDATLCAIRIASAKGEFGEAGKTAIREAFELRHDDLDARLDTDGDRINRTTLTLFHITAKHARVLDGEAR